MRMRKSVYFTSDIYLQNIIVMKMQTSVFFTKSLDLWRIYQFTSGVFLFVLYYKGMQLGTLLTFGERRSGMKPINELKNINNVECLRV